MSLHLCAHTKKTQAHTYIQTDRGTNTHCVTHLTHPPPQKGHTLQPSPHPFTPPTHNLPQTPSHHTQTKTHTLPHQLPTQTDRQTHTHTVSHTLPPIHIERQTDRCTRVTVLALPATGAHTYTHTHTEPSTPPPRQTDTQSYKPESQSLPSQPLVQAQL